MAKLSNRVESILDQVRELRDYVCAQQPDVWITMRDAGKLFTAVMNDLDSALLDEAIYSEIDPHPFAHTPGEQRSPDARSVLFEWHGERINSIRFVPALRDER